MLELTDISNLFHIINPLDLIIAIISFVAGRLLNRKSTRSVGLLMSIAVLFIKMAKHFYDTHPDAVRFGKKYKLAVDRMYHEHVLHEEPPHRGALG